MANQRAFGRGLVILLGAGLTTAVPAATCFAAQTTPQARVTPTRSFGFAGPARERGFGPTQFVSRNWDGYNSYVSTEGTDFDAVSATWVQPTVTCPQPNAWAVFWVGLDGWWDDTVEQGGTSAQCLSGTPSYTAWWEMYPTNAIQEVFSISAGDKMTAGVTYTVATHTFVITVKDVTSGHSFTRKELCGAGLTCNRSSAEAIAEDVGLYPGPGYYPLANYGRMSFSGSQMTDISGHTGSFTDSAWLHGSVTEMSGGVTYAKVSALSATGAKFTAIWNHA
jgi:hypothetical protein